MNNEFPLYNLFTRLRKAGLPLGIEEYFQVLKALQGGFGIQDSEVLCRLCCTLWAKSLDEAELVNYCFSQMFSEVDVGQSASNNQGKNISEGNSFLEDKKTQEIAQYSQSMQQSTGEVQVAKAIHLEIFEESKFRDFDQQFIWQTEYFPVTQRQLKQNWRYLRRFTSSGPTTELAIEETIAKVAQQGILLEPVLIPRRINQVELLLLIDHNGSMAPFHSLSRQLVNSALKGGRLKKIHVFYFHNCPIEYLYKDTAELQAVQIAKMIDNIAPHVVALYFSDAGAARGGLNRERIEWSFAFIQKLRKKISNQVWLNPVPQARWKNTTAQEIANMIPMYQIDTRGLQQVIQVLCKPAPKV